jgi:hypothetical protein
MWFFAAAFAASPPDPFAHDRSLLDAAERTFGAFPWKDCPAIVAQDVPGQLRALRARMDARPTDPRELAELHERAAVLTLTVDYALREDAGQARVPAGRSPAFRFAPLAVSHAEGGVSVYRDTQAEADTARFEVVLHPAGGAPRALTGGGPSHDDEGGGWGSFWAVPEGRAPAVRPGGHGAGRGPLAVRGPVGVRGHGPRGADALSWRLTA